MSLYNSVQSSIGQLQGTGRVVGFEIPFTDIDVDRPPIPVAELHFDNDKLALGSLGVLAIGAIYSASVYRNGRRLRDSVNYPAGDDMQEIAHRSISRQIRRGVVGAAALSTAFAAYMANEAGPHTNETVNEIKSMAVIVDSGYESRVLDVNTEDGETSRVEAAVNGLALDRNALSDLKGIDVTFFAAGAEPRAMGTIDGDVVGSERTEAKQKIIDNFAEYLRNPAQYGTEVSGGGDIAGALAQAESVNPDKTLIVTGTLRGHENSPTLVKESDEGVNNISVIALGKPGSEIERANGDKWDAPIELPFNERLVGVDDSYAATSIGELEDVIEKIVEEQLTNEEHHDVEGFQTLTLTSSFIAGAVLAKMIHSMSGLKPFSRFKRMSSRALGNRK